MKSLKLAAITVAAAVCLPLTLQAHRQWMLPSATILSGNDPWVTVDAAISNDLFYFEHFPMRLENLTVIAPDGSPATAENLATGRYRSTFDVHLTQKGTWKIASVSNTVMASWDDNGAPKTVSRHARSLHEGRARRRGEPEGVAHVESARALRHLRQADDDGARPDQRRPRARSRDASQRPRRRRSRRRSASCSMASRRRTSP